MEVLQQGHPQSILWEVSLMNNLPKRWMMTTLGEICSKPQYGWTCIAEKIGNVKYLRTSDISEGTIGWDSVPCCREIPSDIEKYRVHRDDILVARAGSVGISYRITDVPYDAVFASYLIRFNALEGVEARYIEHYLKSDNYWRSISEFTAGIAVPNVNASKLASLEIPLPPLSEQRRIVTKLEKLLGKVDACQKRLEKIPVIIKRFRQAVLTVACSGRLTTDWREKNPNVKPASEVLGRILKDRDKIKRKVKKVSETDNLDVPFDIPSTWALCVFDDLAAARPNAIKAGPFGSSLTKSCYVPKGFKVYGQEQVINGDPNFGGYYISEEKFNELRSCEVSTGDILVSLVGTIGKVLVIPKQFQPGIINPRLAKFSLHSSIVRGYITNYLLSPIVKNILLQQSHGGTMKILNLGIMRALPITLPPLPEQHEIVRRVEALFALADQIEARYKKVKAYADKLTQSILAKAFRGELVPQNPNDEPASELLKRLRTVQNISKKNFINKMCKRKK